MKINNHTKLSILVIVVAALLLETNTALEFFSTRDRFNEQLTEKAQRDLNESHRIARVKQEVQEAVVRALPAIARQAVATNTDSLSLLLRHLTASQPQIVGAAFGYVPGYIHSGSQDNSQYGVYMYETDEDGEAIDGGEATIRGLIERPFDIDYTERPWYEQAFRGADYWTPPYEGRFSYVLMSSYSQPVRDDAALLMTVMRALFRTEAGRVEPSPTPAPIREGRAAAIVQRLHSTLCEDQAGGYFATMFVGVLDLRTGVLDYCNAGHERPIVSGKTADREQTAEGGTDRERTADREQTADRERTEEGGADRERTADRERAADRERTEEGGAGYTGGADRAKAAWIETERNLAVGALPEWRYEGETTTLKVGEMLFIYTDGLNEARNAKDEPLSRGRVLSLARQYSNETPQHFVVERDDIDVVLDCAEPKFISSSGLRLLLNIYKHVHSNGHSVSFTGLRPGTELYDALDLAGFFKLFKQN